MSLQLDPRLLASLVTNDPEATVHLLLRHIIERCRAKGGAVIKVAVKSETVALKVMLACDLGDERACDVRGLWERHQDTLQWGGHVKTQDELLIPLRKDQTFLGFLLLDVPTSHPSPAWFEHACKWVVTGMEAAKVQAQNAKCTVVVSPKELQRQLQEQELVEALDQMQGNKVQAAKLLGITRRTLYSRLYRFKIAWPGMGQR